MSARNGWWTMVWEAVGIGTTIGLAALGWGAKLTNRISVLEAKHEALKESVDRIESKVDDLPAAVVAEMRGRK